MKPAHMHGAVATGPVSCLVEDEVIQPPGPLGQQPGDGLGEGVTHQGMAEYPAAVLVKWGDVEVHSAGFGLIWGDVPACALRPVTQRHRPLTVLCAPPWPQQTSSTSMHKQC